MANYNWTKLFRTKGGHKYFRDEITGRIAVADDSGSTPDRTEDGVLWLDQSRCVTIATDRDHNNWITVPVFREDGTTRSCTPASAQEAVEVCARFGMKLALNGERFVMVRTESEVAEQERNKRAADQHCDV